MDGTRFDASDPLDRLDQFIAFADWWYEQDDQPRNFADYDVDAELAKLSFRVPEVLQRIYRAARNWPITRPYFLNQNDLLSPERLVVANDEFRQVFDNHGLLVFAVENQGVTWWACPLGEVDPPVYDRESEDRKPGEPAGKCSDSLVDFLIGYWLAELSLHGRSVTLGGLEDFLAENPNAYEHLLIDGFGSGFTSGIFEEEVLFYRTFSSTFASVRTEAGKDVLRRFAGPLRSLELTWQVGKGRNRRPVTVSLNNKGTAVIESKRFRSIRYSHELSIETSLETLYNELIAHRGDEGPILSADQLGKSVLPPDEVLDTGFAVNLDGARSIVAGLLDTIVDPSPKLTADRPFLAGPAKGLAPDPIYRRAPTLLDAPFVNNELSDLIAGSTWSGGSTDFVFAGDGTVTDDRHNRSGIWRADEDLFFRIDRIDHFYQLTLDPPRLTGTMFDQWEPFTQTPITFFLTDPGPGGLTVPDVDDPLGLANTTWAWGTRSAVTFLADGRAKFDFAEGGSRTSWGSWISEGNDVIFDVNNFTGYDVVIEGGNMTGVSYRVATPVRRTPTSLKRVIDADQPPAGEA